MQQIYMIPTFRKSILESKDPLFKDGPLEDNVFYQL